MDKVFSENDLTDIDIEILKLLQEDGVLSTTHIGQKLSLSTTPCWRRKKGLEDSGYINGYQANIDRSKLGYDVVVFVNIKFSDHANENPDRFEDLMSDLPEVLLCNKVTGDADYIIMLIAKNLKEYGNFIEETLRKQPEIISINSSFSVKEIKFTSKIPIKT